MSREILTRALELAKQGMPDEGIHLLRNLLRQEEFRKHAVPILAFCHEQKRDYSTAAHLYLQATKLNPTHPEWPKRLQICNAELAKSIAEAEAQKGWGKRCGYLAPILLLLGAIAVILAVVTPEFLVHKEVVLPTLISGVIFLAAAATLLADGMKRVQHRKRKIRAARGTDYSQRIRVCWACELPVPEQEKKCVFCDANKKQPKVRIAKPKNEVQPEHSLENISDIPPTQIECKEQNQKEQSQKEKKPAGQIIEIVAILFSSLFCAPLGLLIAWRSSQLTKMGKIIVSILCICLYTPFLHGISNGISKGNEYDKPCTFTLDKGVQLEMVPIASGSFQMGSNDGDSNEKPIHSVEVDGFLMGKYEVTQAQYQAIMGTNPVKDKEDIAPQYPVVKVSWDEAKSFCQKLSKKTGKPFRLPTEAEWEYACRAGSTGKWCFGDSDSELGDYAWYQGNSDKYKMHPVGQKKPNVWGLYDMHGNVPEMCLDWYDDDKTYYANSPKRNPCFLYISEFRVVRGDDDDNVHCRSSSRGGNIPSGNNHLGFRIVSSKITFPNESEKRLEILSKDQWKNRAGTAIERDGKNEKMLKITGRIICNKDVLYKYVGKPTQTQKIGENMCLSWVCSDGVISITGKFALMYNSAGMIMGEVNEN